MNTGLMSYNVNASALTETEMNALINHLRVLKPAIVLVMNDDKKDDPAGAVERGLRIQRETGAEVIHRQYEPDDQWAKESADSWFARHRIYGQAGLTLYAYNEPQEGQHGSYDDLAAKLLRIGQLCVQHRLRVVLGNFSVGTPNERQWHRFDAVLRLIAANPKYLRLGLHEYAPHLMTAEFSRQHGDLPDVPVDARPYLVGRFRWLRDYQRARGIGRVPIAITEFGWDTIYDPAFATWQQGLTGYADRAGYHVAKRWWQTYMSQYVAFEAAMQIHWAMEEIYRPDPDVLGMCFYCWGGRGDWLTNFDVKDEINLQTYLAGIDWRRSVAAWYKIESEGGALVKARVVMADTRTTLNVRTLPHVGAPAVDMLKHGDEIEYFEDSLARNVSGQIYEWRRLKDNRWIAMIPGMKLPKVNPALDEALTQLAVAESAIAEAKRIIAAQVS